MKISPEKLAVEAETTGFRPDVLERVAHLLGLLDAIRSHPLLKEKLALKGGTALDLVFFDAPWLSVDIDLNYVGVEDRESMLAERPRIEKAVQAVFAREGFNVSGGCLKNTQEANGRCGINAPQVIPETSKWTSTPCSEPRYGRCRLAILIPSGLGGPREFRCWVNMNWQPAPPVSG